MVYGQVPPAEPRPPGRGGAIAVGVLLVVQLLLELIVLAYDVTQAGPAYLVDALGLSYTHYVVAPVGFFGYDAALCVALVVLAVGAFRGGAWARPSATVLLAVNAYSSSAAVVSQLSGTDSGSVTDTPGHLALVAVPVLSLLLAVAVGAVTAATRVRTPAPLPAYAAPYAPYAQPGAFPQQYPPQPSALPQPPVLPQPPGAPQPPTAPPIG